MKKMIFLFLSVLSFAYSEEFKINISNELKLAYKENYKIYKSIYIGDELGKSYYMLNSNVVRPLASLTKLMTATLIFEDIKKGEYTLNTEVIGTLSASKVPYGTVIKEGTVYKIEDLLKLLLLNSSNSAAYLLAQNSSKNNIDNFVKRMNKKSRELKLNSLRFYTPHGLPPVDTNTKMDVGNSRDMYKLAKYLIDNTDILKITNTYTTELSDGSKIFSTNELIRKNVEVKGLKTGFHRKAGYNIVNYMEFENGEKIIEVILGSDSSKLREKVGLKTIEVMKSGG